MCRTWAGGPWLAVDCGTDVSIEGEEHIKIFNSSMWAERGFCSQCGTNLFYRLKGNGQHILAAGLFGDDDGFELDHQVFIDEKPSWYGFAQETRDMTGAEVFAMYAPKK